ncbi:MAG: NHLP family bacteriocin export ABC transporter peptidase/permease/ATPase subunit [Gemmatimonas sp.]
MSSIVPPLSPIAFKPRSRAERQSAHTPTILQMESAECGAAALAMVLAYFGRYVPLEELRVACGVSREGVNAENITKAAQSYGLEAHEYSCEPEELTAAKLPAIIFWNFNHFVVLDGIEANAYHLNDPAVGPRRVSNEEMDGSFTGLVIEFARTNVFVRQGTPPSLWAKLSERVVGSKNALLFALLAGVALAVTGLVIPMFAKIFIDDVVVHRRADWVRPLLFAMLVTTVVRTGLVWLQQYYLLRLETKLAVTSSSKFLWHLLHLPVEFYAQRYTGEISWRTGLNDKIANFLSRKMASAAIDALMIVFFALLMLTYDVQLTLIAFACVGVIVVSTVAVNRLRIDGSRRVLQLEGKTRGTLMAGLSAIETLKASALESDFFARWAGYQSSYLSAMQSLDRTTMLFMLVPSFTTAVTNALVLFIGARRVISGDFTLGTLVAFQTLLASFIRPINNFVLLASTVQEMHARMAKVDDVLRYPATVPDVDSPEERNTTVERLRGRVELRNVTFGYSTQAEPLIRDFSLLLQPGTRVALVGASGCGKSTVAKLVSSLYAPWSGEVLFDNVPAGEWPRSTRAASVAMVDQDISLFAGTVRENLSLWDLTIPEDALATACKDASIHSAIMSRPGGIDAMVEEGGANFSGGQRQRMEIARALVGNPSVLVLDEATSALDAVTEQIIDRNLRRRGCTCIIIAHRLSTIRDADEIVVLDAGRVVQRGTHDELMRDRHGLYYYQAQGQ